MGNFLNKIYFGTLQKFNELTDKDINSLYMLYDETTGTKCMYRGGIRVSGDFIIINGKQPLSPSIGQIYYISSFVDENTNETFPFTGFFDGKKWVDICYHQKLLKIEERLNIIEGNGEGSIKKAISDTKNEIIGNATTDFNNLGKIENKIIETATIWEEY